jgi:hypothetical protein
MPDRAYFPDSDSLLEETRFAYSEIYYWHVSQGKRRFEERFKERQESEIWRAKYLALLAELVKPKEATIQDMLSVAREVLSGQMEWAYSEKSEQGVTLSNWARRIEELLNEQEKRLAREKISEQLHAFGSLGRDGKITEGLRIEIPMQEKESWNVHTYLDYAKTAYRDVPETETVGGKIFLTQTNLELTHGNKEQYVFHNAALLHAEKVVGEHTLVELIEHGALFVEAVALGE